MTVEKISNTNIGTLRLNTLSFTRDSKNGLDRLECECEFSAPPVGRRVTISDSPIVELGSFPDALNGVWELQDSGRIRREIQVLGVGLAGQGDRRGSRVYRPQENAVMTA